MQNDLNERQLEALRFIRNTIVHGGRSPSVRDLAQAMRYRSPRSALLILQQLMEAGYVSRTTDGDLRVHRQLAHQQDHARTVDVPLVGTVPCGAPFLAEENIEMRVPISRELLSSGSQYFILRATGDSMNAAGIKEGNLLLVRQQSHANNGDKVVALIDDEATVKEFHRENAFIILKPRSTNRTHKPIVLTQNFILQGVVVAVIPASALTTGEGVIEES